MDETTINCARLLAHEGLAPHYRAWLEGPLLRPDFTGTQKAIVESVLGLEETGHATLQSKSWETRLNQVLEEVLTRASRNARSGAGSAKETAADLDAVASLAEKLHQEAQASLRSRGTHEAAESRPEVRAEDGLREWLGREAVAQAASAEPVPSLKKAGRNEDPWKAGLEKLDALRATPRLHNVDGGNIAFPLASVEMDWKPKTATGIDAFDLVELDGGAEEDTVMILSGETNIGKSHLGLYGLSCLSLRRETVLLCSGEDGLETTRRRIFSHYLRLPARQVQALGSEGRLLRMRQLYGHEEDPQSLHYHIVRRVAVACIPEGAFTPQEVEKRIDELEQQTQTHVRAFMADYLQKMAENPAGRSPRRARDEELERIVNQMKDLCQRRKSFCNVISQVSSSGAGGTEEFLGAKQAVARSYAATWGAHYIITINRTREEVRRLAVSDDKRPRLNLFLCKSKDTPLGVCYALGHPAEARWEFHRSKEARDDSAERAARREAALTAQNQDELLQDRWRQSGPEPELGEYP